MDGTLFDYPATRNSDPRSSDIAEERITNSGKRSKQAIDVYETLRIHDGSTSSELGKYMGRPEIPHRRLPDLENAGWIRRGPMRNCTNCNQLCVTWFVEDS